MLSINVAEWEVRRVGLDMSGKKACENRHSMNSWVGIAPDDCTEVDLDYNHISHYNSICLLSK